jgi:hypothetical protein
LEPHEAEEEELWLDELEAVWEDEDEDWLEAEELEVVVVVVVVDAELESDAEVIAADAIVVLQAAFPG